MAVRASRSLALAARRSCTSIAERRSARDCLGTCFLDLFTHSRGRVVEQPPLDVQSVWPRPPCAGPRRSYPESSSREPRAAASGHVPAYRRSGQSGPAPPHSTESVLGASQARPAAALSAGQGQPLPPRPVRLASRPLAPRPLPPRPPPRPSPCPALSGRRRASLLVRPSACPDSDSAACRYLAASSSLFTSPELNNRDPASRYLIGGAGGGCRVAEVASSAAATAVAASACAQDQDETDRSKPSQRDLLSAARDDGRRRPWRRPISRHHKWETISLCG